MGIRAGLVLLVFLVAGTVRVVHAQSLADVARQEAERRKSVAAAGKVYGNKDLKGATPGLTIPAIQAATPSPVAPAPTEPVEQTSGTTADAAAASEVKDQAYWSGRITTLRDQLNRDQTYVEALQSRVNALTNDAVNRDDPAQRAAIEVNRQKALIELERLKKAIVAGVLSIAALEEEARRAGVPAGWLR